MQVSHSKSRRRSLRVAAIATACAMLAQPSFAGGKAKTPFCASDRDLAALNARVLQTELMVAALSCGERQRYNTFVTTYQSVLVDRGQALQAMFRRAHGARAVPALNAFVTKMANDSSHAVQQKGDHYCVFAGELFDETLVATPRDLNRVTNKSWIANRHGYKPCVVESGRKQTG